MISSTSAPPRRQGLPISSVARSTGITVYGCESDEAGLFEALAPRAGLLARITKAPVSARNLELAVGNRCISVGHKSRVADSTLRALSQAGVRHIITRSVGRNHLDAGYAESVGISVATVAYSPDSVADYTLMLMLMALRDAKTTIRATDVHDYRLPVVRGRELRDLTVGVIGTGRIGTAVISRLRGFGSRILAHDARREGSGERVSLDRLVRESDLLTLHTPLTEKTHHLLNRHRIAQMRRGAYLVNTGRGALLDTGALVDSLESGMLGGAALDVLEGEEGIFYADCGGKPVGNPLLLRLQRLPNVIISPHAAYYTDHALRDTVEHTIAICLSFEREHRHA